MRRAAVEVVVVERDRPSTDLSAALTRLLALGVDVVLGPSCAGAAVDPPPGAPGRLVVAPADDDLPAWARQRLLGPGAPEGAVAVVADIAGLDAQVEAAAGFPAPVPDPAWRLEVDGFDPGRQREVEAWLTVGNGRTGTRGVLEEGSAGSGSALYVAGIFGRDPAALTGPELVPGPDWTRLQPAADQMGDLRRILDLRQGILFREGGAPGTGTARFASLADRRLLVLEAEGDGWRAGEVPVPTATGPVEAVDAPEGPTAPGATVRMALKGRGGGAVSFAISTTEEPGRVRRVVAVDRGPVDRELVDRELADRELVDRDAGADPAPGDVAVLRARHRRAWRERWLDADIAVHGDPDAQLAMRFALYHLIAAGDPESDVASIGARAMTGPGYRGHVFWDTEIFVLPFFVWTHPQTARALLAYRYRTLPAARAKAARLGYAGALFAWESADTGEETTPEFAHLPDGTRLTILTGVQEHHIAADVAWAVMHYWQVTGDDAFLEEMGAEIVVETARFWASRATPGGDGRLHVCQVIGPDEYHEGVDDNAYTNVMARWNLRAAQRLCDRLPEAAARLGVGAEERARWDEVAAGLVDGFDPQTLVYEQFDGFYALDAVRAADLAPRPFTGEMVVGVERLRHTQIVKQADVVMLGVLLPEEIAPDVQAANYRHYEPLTSHGSSLSPAMHALAAARVGDPDEAQRYFDLAAGVDLHNRMGNAADGVHIATMGGLWQAAVMGFGGVRAESDAVRIDPRLPAVWAGLNFSVRWRGVRISVDVRRERLALELDGPADVALGPGPARRLEAGAHGAQNDGGGWSWTGPA
jgi:trehalose/maltose hydrolase-like predicted phosphorylase